MPYMRLAIAFLGGIIWQCSAWQFNFQSWKVMIILFLLFLGLLFTSYFRHYSRQWIIGASALLCLFFAGITTIQLFQKESLLPLQKDIYIKAVISEKGRQGNKYNKVHVTILSYSDSSGTHIAKEKSIFYLENDSTQVDPAAEDTIIALVRLTMLPPPQNPGEFNYQAYMARRKIFTSGFIRKGQYMITRTQTANIAQLPAQLRERAMQVFTDKGLTGDELAVITALTLGDKTLLDDELRTAYAASGATHILAVSGLHVGIIFAILSLAFSFLTKIRHGRAVKNGIILFCLWGYAAMIGFSPSVTRATVMFSFVLAGQMIQRKISIYNSLSASAFFICLFRPMDIFDAGFQLSYCAVFSIVYFQPFIYRLWYTKNKILDYMWQLLSVSFAAQIGTLPITLFSFHQFPNYFLLTNLWVIPLTGIIVYLSAGVMITSWIPTVSDILARILDISLRLLNSGVKFIDHLPYAVTQNIYINEQQLLVMAILCLLTALYLDIRSRKLLLAIGYLSVIFFAVWRWNNISQQHQSIVAVYNVKNTSYIHMINGRKSITFRDNNPEEEFEFNLKSFFIAKGLAGSTSYKLDISVLPNDTIIDCLHIYRDLIIFNDKLYKILRNNSSDKISIPVDYLIATSQWKEDPKIALNIYQPAQVILDASVPAFRIRRWKNECQEKSIPLHSVKDSGAWLME
jgi:competence protein ComEC